MLGRDGAVDHGEPDLPGPHENGAGLRHEPVLGAAQQNKAQRADRQAPFHRPGRTSAMGHLPGQDVAGKGAQKKERLGPALHFVAGLEQLLEDLEGDRQQVDGHAHQQAQADREPEEAVPRRKRRPAGGRRRKGNVGRSPVHFRLLRSKSSEA